jgi:hypothetical protein
MSQTIEVFVHSEGTKPRLLTASPTESLGELLIRAGIAGEGREFGHVFVGECLEALDELPEVDNGQDTHAPADLTNSLEQLDLRHHKHLHCHRCRHVAVEVNYNNKTKRHRFSPATTIAVVTKWSLKKFELTDSAAADYVLRICGGPEQPRPNEHLGELVKAPDCRICFDIVKEVTPQG